MSYMEKKQLLDAGAQSEIAKHSLLILENTEQWKHIRDKMNAMHDPEVDEWLRELGRSALTQPKQSSSPPSSTSL